MNTYILGYGLLSGEVNVDLNKVYRDEPKATPNHPTAATPSGGPIEDQSTSSEESREVKSIPQSSRYSNE